jgi:hypothetical protein
MDSTSSCFMKSCTSSEWLELKKLEKQLLHKNIIITSGKQTSAQSSVFYVKLATDIESGIDRELILKVFRESEDYDKKGFYKEVNVIKAIMDFQRKNCDNFDEIA